MVLRIIIPTCILPGNAFFIIFPCMYIHAWFEGPSCKLRKAKPPGIWTNWQISWRVPLRSVGSWDLIVFLQSIRKQGLVHAPADLFLQKGLNFTKLSMFPPIGCFQWRLRQLGDRPSKKKQSTGLKPPYVCMSTLCNWTRWAVYLEGYLCQVILFLDICPQPLYQSGVDVSLFSIISWR